MVIVGIHSASPPINRQSSSPTLNGDQQLIGNSNSDSPPKEWQASVAPSLQQIETSLYGRKQLQWQSKKILREFCTSVHGRQHGGTPKKLFFDFQKHFNLGMPAHRTSLQRAQALNNLAGIHHQNHIRQTRQHRNPIPTSNTVANKENQQLEAKVQTEKKRADTFERKFRNKTKEARRAKHSRDILRKENERVEQNLRLRGFRALKQKENRVKKAKEQAHKLPGEFYIKEKGVIKNTCRIMIRELGAMNIPEEKTARVIKTVANGFGVDVMDYVSARTVGRIMKEGGVAAQIQMVYEVDATKGITLSSDGTTIRHRNYESRHVTLRVPAYGGNHSSGNEFTTRFMGIGSAPNHTSNTQLHGLQQQVQEIYKTFNKSRLGERAPVDVITFPTYVMGLGSDHAEDQKRLSKLMLQWKVISTKQIHGRRYMEAVPLNNLMPIILEASHQKIEDVGGITAWDALSEEEKYQRDAEANKQLCTRFGEEAWNQLSEDERRQAQLFVWGHWRRGTASHPNLLKAELSRNEKDRIWIDTTNDVNEGALGTTRQSLHHAPNITLPKLNARMMYRKNNTASFVEHTFNTTADQAFLRSESRKQDAAGMSRKSRQEEVSHDREEVERKRTKDVGRKAQADARIAVLDALQLELDIETLTKGIKAGGKTLKVSDIRLQIAWHRRHDSKIPPKGEINKMNKPGLLQELIKIVKRLPAEFSAACFPESQPIQAEQDVSISVGGDWEEVEDREDADMRED
ncbi:hypothetical protein B0H34DRAFT_849024 [Crassisporium funariophilum]|nr:hypothetical protein B0H34DRAFT_849024 [Crassisporium funariophilum]